MAINELDEPESQRNRDCDRRRHENSGKEICSKSTEDTDPQDRFGPTSPGSADNLLFCHVIVFTAYWGSYTAIYRDADEMSQTGSSLMTVSDNMNFINACDLPLYGVHESAHKYSL